MRATSVHTLCGQAQQLHARKARSPITTSTTSASEPKPARKPTHLYRSMPNRSHVGCQSTLQV